MQLVRELSIWYTVRERFWSNLGAGLRSMAQSIETGAGTARVIVAVSVIVIAAIVVGVGTMAVVSSNQIAALTQRVDDGFTNLGGRIDEMNRRLDQRDQRGPPP